MYDLEVLINGVDKSTLVTEETFVKSDSLYQAADVLKFDILTYNGQSYTPEVNDEVIINDNGDKVFGGYIMNIDKDIDLALNIVTNHVTATDYGQALNRMLIIERIENSTVNDVIAYLLTKYYPDYDDLYVDAAIPVTSITFNNISVQAALEKLSKLTNYSWYVDYDKHVHFFEKTSETAPFDITDGDGNYIPDTMSVAKDLTQIKNRITVKGGEVEVNEVTFEVTGAQGKVQDNGNTTFDTSYKFSKKPTVLLNGSPVLVGVVGFDDEANFDAMWSFTQKYITFVIYVDPADDVSITGIPLETLQVRVQDSVSIAQYGRWDAVISVPGIKSQAEALQYANAQKDLYKDPEWSCKFATYESGLRSGQLINVNSTKFGVNEDFIVQRVTFKKIAQNKAYWEVELSTTRQITLVDILSDLLGVEEIDELSSEALLSYIEFSETANFVDGVPSLTSGSGPYQVWPDVGSGTGAPAKINFSTVSA